MIHVGRRSYPYMEEINEGIVRQFRGLSPHSGQVLDVGCGRGALGDTIRKAGWEVYGIERSEEACPTARSRLDRLIEADLLDGESVERQLGDARFDFLIFSDVLEHLYDPRTVLETYLRYLKPGGKVLISVPNAVMWTNRPRWTLGSVSYADTGVTDRTHIQFFTFWTARQPVAATGCRVTKTDFTPYLVRAAMPLAKRLVGGNHSSATSNPRSLIDSPGYKRYMRYIYPDERLAASLRKKMFCVSDYHHCR